MADQQGQVDTPNSASNGMQALVSAYHDDDEIMDTSANDNKTHNDISDSEDEGSTGTSPASTSATSQPRPTSSQPHTLSQPTNEDSNSRPPTGARLWTRADRPDKKATILVSYGNDEMDDDDDDKPTSSDEDIATGFISYLKSPRVSTENQEVDLNTFYQSLHHQLDESVLPPEPPGKCSVRLQEKIKKLYARVQSGGPDLNNSIQSRKDFRNPSIYEKLIEFCGIDEKGTNYPPELYNPLIFGADSSYEELARIQKEEMDKREKEKKDRTKIEFVMGTKKGSVTSMSSTSDPKVKVKGESDATTSSTTTIIPAVGPITKHR